ncbi:MAG TPA: response regulator transcription factor [Ktedonobacterales bacterium]|nr:response regulator transcription factor [Ktedonobacterales bacterium]
MRILVVDDDEKTTEMVQFLLSRQGYQVDTVDNGRGALALIERHLPDLMLLDVGLPQMSGFEFYERLRRDGYDIPVIFVTGADELEDRLQGLNMGADDYICKPFHIAELTARVEAVLRRYRKANTVPRPRLQPGNLDIDVAGLQVALPDGRVAQLTPREMQLLLKLAEHPGQVISREDLMDAVWGENYPGESNIVDVYVRRLRRKIERDPASPELIQVARGVGYRFVGEA